MTTSLTLEEYQLKTAETAVYPEVGEGSVLAVAYCGLGLGEAGEVQGKIKKILRDSNGIINDEHRSQIEGELGDVLWYVAQLASELGLSLELVAQHNLDKLADRRARGVLQGSGDNR